MSYSPTVVEDALVIMGTKPILFSDLVGALRGSINCPKENPTGRRWRINEGELEWALRHDGCYFAQRKHASGIALYVGRQPFDFIVDGRGRSREVSVD